MMVSSQGYGANIEFTPETSGTVRFTMGFGDVSINLGITVNGLYNIRDGLPDTITFNVVYRQNIPGHDLLFTDRVVGYASEYWLGGSGVWNDTELNWTDANGLRTIGWDTGSAGRVTVASEVKASRIGFVTDGYQLVDGGGALVLNGTNTEISVAAGASAEIGAVISGSGGILKTGFGSLRLTGSNSYQDATVVVGGELVLVGESASITTEGGAYVYGGAFALSEGASASVGDTEVGGHWATLGGIGILAISDGARLETLGNATVGHVANTVGGVFVSGSGSQWSVEGDLSVGNAGLGRVMVSDGARWSSKARPRWRRNVLAAKSRLSEAIPCWKATETRWWAAPASVR